MYNRYIAITEEEKKRDYRSEYDNYQSKPDQKKNRAKRNKVRNELEKKGRVKKNDGKDVDHIIPLSKNGGNGHDNLRVVDKSTNRKKK